VISAFAIGIKMRPLVHDIKNTKGNFPRQQKTLKVFICYLFSLSAFLFSPFVVTAQETTVQSVQDKLTAAEELYYEGLFNGAITLIDECLLSKSIQLQEQKNAYKLLANIRLAQENRKAAEAGIRKLLILDPEYTPTLEQETPQFVSLISEVKAKIEQEKPKKKTWLWIGAGATAVVAVATYFIIQGHENGEQPPEQDRPLALPPDWPE
jgi:hypothetical protein